MLTLTAGGIDLGLPLYNTRLNTMENKAVVNSFVPAVASSWKREPLAKRAAPELSPRLNPDEWRAFLDFTARLGPFLKYEGADGRGFHFPHPRLSERCHGGVRRAGEFSERHGDHSHRIAQA